jgi:hypothetical protein
MTCSPILRQLNLKKESQELTSGAEGRTQDVAPMGLRPKRALTKSTITGRHATRKSAARERESRTSKSSTSRSSRSPHVSPGRVGHASQALQGSHSALPPWPTGRHPAAIRSLRSLYDKVREDDANAPHLRRSRTPRLGLPATALKTAFAPTDTAHAASEEYRSALLKIMATSNDATEAWEAYRSLLHSAKSQHLARSSLEDVSTGEQNLAEQDAWQVVVPFAHLHRLARLITSTRPRTRELFLRLLSVINTIRHQGGRLKLWEWNALIDFAGKGWRRTRPDDFIRALNFFEEMVAHSPRNGDLALDDFRLDERQHRIEDFDDTQAEPSPMEPDIVTYSTLLNVASRTRDERTLQLAASLLQSAGITSNRVTNLIFLAHATRQGDLPGVHNALATMFEHGQELGLDGVNACLWGFARCGRLDIANAIYRVLRHHYAPELGVQGDEVAIIRKRLAEEEHVLIPTGMVPDHVTYTAWIQIQCYRGNLHGALETFTDMLETTQPSYLSNRFPKNDKDAQEPFSPTMPIFRALFIGFARYAVSSSRKQDRPQLVGFAPHGGPVGVWTLEQLHVIFQAFLALPPDSKPSERTIYNILVAFNKASGQDAHTLKRVWSTLADRYGGSWGGRLERFRKRLFLDLP